MLPLQGIGKPEPLKFLGAGVWSRRITQEHRLVYVVSNDRIDFIQGRYHWCDKDHVMLHAVFQLLADFVEQEKPDQIVDWNSDPAHKQAWKEIRSLYRWWTQTRPARNSPLDEKGLKKPPMRWKKIDGTEPATCGLRQEEICRV
jgi:hypothetical protein